MRHRVAGVHLGRSSGHRTALRRNLVTEFLRTEKIRTTRAKAAAIRGQAERMITSAKRGNAAGEAKAVHARRLAAAKLNDPADRQEALRRHRQALSPNGPAGTPA